MHVHAYFLTENSLDNAQNALTAWESWPDATILANGAGQYIVTHHPDTYLKWKGVEQVSPEELEKLLND